MRKEQIVMKKRDPVDAGEQSAPRVSGDEIRAMNGRAGLQNLTAEDRRQHLMEGHFWHRQISDDISLHVVDGCEVQAAISTAEVAPGLSINIVFEADLRFSLGGRKHSLKHTSSVEDGGVPLLHTMVVGQRDIFSRYLEAGHRVRKINITLAQSWFERRSVSGDDFVRRLFSHHGCSKAWPLPAHLLDAVTSLMTTDNRSDLQSQVNAEYLVLAIVRECLHELSAMPEGEHAYPPAADAALLSLVDRAVLHGSGVKEIAADGRMSVSTLQKRFKSSFNMTVQKYIRKRQLEQARRALLVAGVSIGEVAYQAGYNHSSNFITAFRREFGVTPAQCIEQFRPLTGSGSKVEL